MFRTSAGTKLFDDLDARHSGPSTSSAVMPAPVSVKQNMGLIAADTYNTTRKLASRIAAKNYVLLQLS